MKKNRFSIYLIFILATQIAVGGNSNSDSLKSVCPDKHIALIDTSDCLYQIFRQNLNPKFIRARAARINKNPIEIPLNTLAQIAKSDSTLREEYYENTLIGIEFCKIYQSAHLRECGFEISGGKVGKWKYFSAKGELDSIVDYEIRRAFPFMDFVNIARAFGMVGKNSKMPNRQRYFEIADSLGLRHDATNYKYAYPYWSKYEFYPISKEEENRKFTSKFRYASDSPFQEWIVEKIFRIEDKTFIFYLTVFPKTKGVMIYEYMDQIVR